MSTYFKGKQFGQRGLPFLNVAKTVRTTSALGLGRRAAIWLQGCLLHCQGCISPEWIPDIPARQVSPEELAEQLLLNPEIQGVSVSGGEPMLQAAGLARMIRYARARRELDVICFTGCSYAALKAFPTGTGVQAFLEEIDLLIDGPFIKDLSLDIGLRGSTNQRFIKLSDRFKDIDFENSPRRLELIIQGDQAFLIGIPPRSLQESLVNKLSNLDPALLKRDSNPSGAAHVPLALCHDIK